MSALEETPDGFRLTVRLTPNAAKDALEGAGADAAGRVYLKARVRAVPEDGKANAALCALLAKTLGVAKSAVTVERGATARLKAVKVAGDADARARALALMETRP